MNIGIEKKVADTVLQQPLLKQIGKYRINVPAPTTATLIEVSALISQLPKVTLDKENIVNESLRIAKDCSLLGEIAATLLLGFSKRRSSVFVKKHFIGKLYVNVLLSRSKLADILLNNLSPKELNQLVINLLSKLDIADFFGLTISLLEISMLSPTREMVKTTASGLQSQEL